MLIKSDHKGRSIYPVVKNAIDFLNTSIKQLEENPKYSMINFYSAIELCLKARLMDEHWSLISVNIDKISQEKLKRGDFHSVGLEQARERLGNLTGQGLEENEYKCFDSLRIERNKLVHFYSTDFEKSKENLFEYHSKQLTAWYYLYHILIDRWDETFRAFFANIEELNRIMYSKKEFLRAKYKTILPDIEMLKKKGVHFGDCQECDLESLGVFVKETPVAEYECLVCGFEGFYLKLECEKCNANYFHSVGDIKCTNCDNEVEFEEIREKYISPNSPLCNSCCHPKPTTINLSKDEVEFIEDWFCINCFQRFSRY